MGKSVKQSKQVERRAIIEMICRMRELVATDPGQVEAACGRLNETTERFIARKLEEHRERVRTELKLLPLAREIAISRLAKRADFEAPSALIVDPDHPPPGFEAIGLPHDQPVPLRIARAYEAIGRWDYGVNRLLESQVGFMEAAQTGEFGEWRAESKIVLANTSAVDAYSHALSVPLSHPTEQPKERKAEEDIRERLDPDGFPALPANGWWALIDLLTDMVRVPGEVPTGVPTRAESWETVVVALAAADPDFDPAIWGWRNAPAWCRDSDEGGDASFSDRAKALDFALHLVAENPKHNAQYWGAVETAIRIVGSPDLSNGPPRKKTRTPASGGSPAPNGGDGGGPEPPGPREMSKEALVLAALADHPDWTDKQIAQAAGCSRTALYRMARFKLARKIQKEARLPRGTKSRDGQVEAWDEE